MAFNEVHLPELYLGNQTAIPPEKLIYPGLGSDRVNDVIFRRRV